ncbi:Os08g0203600, partial [Oryza sativa Japonica Group]
QSNNLLIPNTFYSVLRNCRISGDLGAVDFSKFTKLAFLDLSFNNISGKVPQSILNLQMLTDLFLGNNSLTGGLPDGISPSLKNLCVNNSTLQYS